MSTNYSPLQTLETLRQVAAQHATEIANHADDDVVSSDEESDSNSPIYDSFYDQGGPEAIKSMTNFGPPQFTDIWLAVSTFVSANWNTGRGRKTKVEAKDVLFMMMTVLKHGQQWDFTARLFKMKTCTFERIISGFINMLAPHLYETCVRKLEEKWTVAKLRSSNTTFQHFHMARYATDVTFQQSYRPSGSMAEGKKYFSGKHKLYGYKVEVSVLPNGFAIGCTKHHPGSVADLEIFRHNRIFHEEATRKYVTDLSFDDMDIVPEHSADYWAILADKGYQGAVDELRVIHPIRTPIRGSLSLADMEFNQKVSSDRIIVENFFGRMTSMFTVLSHKYKWGEKMYDNIFMICLALTNIHIKGFPLRASDRTHYQGVRKRLLHISREEQEKKREAYQRRLERRRNRMENTVRTMLFEDSE